ncbi:T9SS type A sorting domain-containing protein [Flavobacterium jumunjinense]
MGDSLFYNYVEFCKKIKHINMGKIYFISIFLFTSIFYSQTYTVNTFASNDTGQFFNAPCGMTIDTNDNLYITDYGTNSIKKIASNGTVTLIAGGNYGYVNGTVAEASFFEPYGLAIDTTTGNIFIADRRNHCIRKITPSGDVSTFAGNPVYEIEGYYLDGNGTNARFNSPSGIAIDANGNLFVADRNNHCIRKITPAGDVSTVAGNRENQSFVNGNGANAYFNNPIDLDFDTNGNLYIADYDNQVIRKMTPNGDVSTFSGTGQSGNTDGTSSVAQFNGPNYIEVDNSGNVFVTDRISSSIRKIDANGTVVTIAGNGNGFQDGEGSSAQFSSPTGIAIDSNGNIFVSDWYNQKIRKITTSALSNPNFELSKQVGIYPNPAKDHFQVDLENSLELKAITVYNNLGQQVVTTNSSKVNTSSLSKGMYYVEIVTNAGKTNKKIIIE